MIKNILMKLSSVPGRIAMAIGVALAYFTVSSSATFATLPLDPLGGELSDTQDRVQTWVLTIGVPALAIATVLGILIRVGFKWLRKVGNRAGA